MSKVKTRLLKAVFYDFLIITLEILAVFVIAYLVDKLIDEGFNDSLWIKTTYATLLLCFYYLLNYKKEQYLNNVQTNFSKDFFVELFEKFIYAKQKFFDSHKNEDLIFRFNETMGTQVLFGKQTLQWLINSVFIVPLLIAILIQSLFIGFIFIAFLSLLFVMYFYQAPHLKVLQSKVNASNANSYSKILDSLLGMNEIKLLGLEEHQTASWRASFHTKLKESNKQHDKYIQLSTLSEFVEKVGFICAFFLLLFNTHSDEISIGGGISMFGLLYLGQRSLKSLVNLFLLYPQVTGLLTGLNDILSQTPENHYKKSELPSKPSISIGNLFFRYNDNQNDVLKGIDLDISFGQKVGIVGRNGCGKSTLAKLLVGLYLDYDGTIKYGNQDLKELDLTTLRKNVFFFSPKPLILNTSIEQNLRIINPTASEDELWEAIELADFKEFVESNYYGINQRIGSGGIMLSKGQELKLEFARLFLRNPEMIILDEASSALDVKSESIIMENVFNYFSKQTIISIAHRLHTIKNMDSIYVLDDGVIAESGSHQELLKKDGIYRAMVSNYI